MGRQPANHMPTVAQKAQDSLTNLLATAKERHSPMNPYSAVPLAIAAMYGQEWPSGTTCAPRRMDTRTARWVTTRKEIGRASCRERGERAGGDGTVERTR